MKVSKQTYASGSVVWVADLGRVNGKRVRYFYPTEREAQDRIDEAKRLKKGIGQIGATLLPIEVAEMSMIRDKLAARGLGVEVIQSWVDLYDRVKSAGSLHEAVDFFLDNRAKVKERILLTELRNRFSDWHEAESSARYADHIQRIMLNFVKTLPNRYVEDVRREDIQRWLTSSGWVGKTYNNHLTDVTSMFSWAIANNYAAVNPAEGIVRKRRVDSGDDVVTYTVDECEKLLRALANDKERNFLTCTVIGLFCGLRRAEMARITWGDVKLDEKIVVVQKKHAKGRRARRVVDISDNAVAWLRLRQMEDDEKILPPDYRYVFLRWRKVHLPKQPWPHNVLRHTYASMHYAMHENEAKLQVQMGHRSAKMLHENYRGLKTRAEAQKFWSLMPPKIKGDPDEEI